LVRHLVGFGYCLQAANYDHHPGDHYDHGSADDHDGSSDDHDHGWWIDDQWA
jgi:hypothetical protein